MTDKDDSFIEEFGGILEGIAEDPKLNEPVQAMKAINVVAPIPSLTERAEMPAVGEQVLPLTVQQKRNIEILAYAQTVKGESRDHEAVRAVWPTDPDLADRAGKRPSAEAIRRYMGTDEYRQQMALRGVTITDQPGLTAEQIAVISHLTDTTATKGLPARLKELGVSNATYKAWLRQKPFNDAIRKLAGHALNDAIPMAEVQLAAQAQAGDMGAIKFMFQVTGRYDPMRQQQVDTQALLAVIIDTMQEVLGPYPDLLKQLSDTIQVRAQGVKGVIGNGSGN